MKPLLDSIAQGREALAQGAGDRGSVPGSPVASLLLLLWHEEREVRQAAARSLPGGDRDHYHEMHYGYFAEAFLRELATRHSPAPGHPAARYGVAAEVLRDLIGQSARDIRAMSGMHYSFLSSALYLALFATCRDAVLAAKRLRSGEVHEALCGLLWNLSAVSGIGRLNPTDTLLLMDLAGLALAFLPPDEIPAFWESLSHANVSPPHCGFARAAPSLGPPRRAPSLGRAAAPAAGYRGADPGLSGPPGRSAGAAVAGRIQPQRASGPESGGANRHRSHPARP